MFKLGIDSINIYEFDGNNYQEMMKKNEEIITNALDNDIYQKRIKKRFHKTLSHSKQPNQKIIKEIEEKQEVVHFYKFHDNITRLEYLAK